MSRDKTDEVIIEMLKKDSRQSFVEIGEKLGLSESAVRRRVKNLTDGGTIKNLQLKQEMQILQVQ